MTDPEEACAPIAVPGHAVLHVVETGSTNALARERVERGLLAAGAIVLTERQSAGRGRQGRPWVTVPGRSLAASLIVDAAHLARPSRASVLLGVAARRALLRVGAVDVQLKWPNDLVRAGLKIGGLLIEGARHAGGRKLLVCGVGVNLALGPGDLPAELRMSAGGAGLPAGPVTRNALLVALAEELDAALAEVGTPADRARGEEYREASVIVGRRVLLLDAGVRREGRVRDVTTDGDLLWEDGGHIAGETAHVLAIEGFAEPEGSSSR